ncbi:hypothetical protein EG329_003467 [Mollisiaceae sp. DMI_Dod_QoI]|nr:hypothetical protein EG329_003467 [Helotiales sp. DMI_Dod_QoI]
MKINCCIAAAIFAFCAAAAPMHDTIVQTSGPLSLGPTSIIITTESQPSVYSPEKGNDGTVVQSPHPDDNQNNNHRKREANVLPAAVNAFIAGNLTAVEVSKERELIRAAQLKSTLASDSSSKALAIPSTLTEAVLSYLDRVADGVIQTGNCTSKQVERRKIKHEHDKSNNVIDDCIIKTHEKTYKEAKAIISRTRTRINTFHTESSSETHKTIDDAADGINSLARLPSEIRDFYLDQLARLNLTSANTFNTTTIGNTTSESWTKTDPDDGTMDSKSKVHKHGKTTTNSHEEVIIDFDKPISIAESNFRSASEVTAKLDSRSPTGFLSTSFVATSPTFERTAAPVKMLSTSSSSSMAPISTPFAALAAPLSPSTRAAQPATTLLTRPSITSATSASSPSSQFITTQEASTTSSRKPTRTRLRHPFFTRTYRPTAESSTQLTEETSSSKISRNQALQAFSRKYQPKSLPTSTNPAMETSNIEIPSIGIVLRKTLQPASTPSALTPTTIISSITTFQDPNPSSFSTNTLKYEDYEGEEDAKDIVGSHGEELETVPYLQQKRDQTSYVAAIQKLNEKHMEEMQVCKANATCVTESTIRFALAVSELDI